MAKKLFEAGNSGRPIGAKNKPKQGKDILEKFFYEDKGLDTLLQNVLEMESDKDRNTLLVKLLEFVLPKQKEIQTNAFDNLRFEILEETEQDNENSESEATDE